MSTTNREDYLRAIYILEEEKHEIKSTDLARYLNISNQASLRWCRSWIKRLYPTKIFSSKIHSKGKVAATLQ